MTAECTLDLWQWSLAIPHAEFAQLEAHLSADEVARADRFVAAVHRAEFIAARGRLREILGAALGQPAATLEFVYGPAGKPALVGAAALMQFNLSHTGGRAALVVTADHPVGIDIEQIRPLKEQIARRYFTTAEADAIAARPAAAQTAAFYRCWTRKEAFVKATGTGIADRFKSFDVSLVDAATSAIVHIDGHSATEIARWRLFHFDPAADICGAIAVQLPTADYPVHLRHRP